MWADYKFKVSNELKKENMNKLYFMTWRNLDECDVDFKSKLLFAMCFSRMENKLPTEVWLTHFGC